jgi:hypothetical protein
MPVAYFPVRDALLNDIGCNGGALLLAPGRLDFGVVKIQLRSDYAPLKCQPIRSRQRFPQD